MNSTWNKNIEFFKNRFPALYQSLEREIEKFSPSLYKTEPAKNGELTASENNIRLHSFYNPGREAEGAVSKWLSEKKLSNAVFFGAGLGYHLVKLASLSPQTSIIYIEENTSYFLEMMYYTDLEPVFKLPNIIFAVNAPLDSAYALIKNLDNENTFLFANQIFTSHAENYFSELKKAYNKNQNRIQINKNTKKKFGKLWFNNGIRNLDYNRKLPGVSAFKDCAKNKNLPFIVIGAGPSLEKALPYLAEIQNRGVTVCADTALKALLSVNIQPDFVVLTDPQYWAYKHIAGLKAPESILITESSVYPPVFRFKCKKIYLTSSLFPWGQFFEEKFGSKGDLGSGGSVSSVCFNFAAFCGATEIFTCGQDLSFTKNQTHIKGSTFEQELFRTNTKKQTPETRTQSVIYSADTSISLSFDGKPVLTDSRMKMFAWWFEKRLLELPDVKAFSLTKESMKLQGFEYMSIEDFLKNYDNKKSDKETMLSQIQPDNLWSPDDFDKAKTEFLDRIYSPKSDESNTYIKETLSFID